MHNIKFICLLGLVLSCYFSYGQTPKREVLYTKSCDTVSVDSIVCIKCTNPGLTINCKRYACDHQDHCIVIGPVLNDRLKDVKSPKSAVQKKK